MELPQFNPSPGSGQASAADHQLNDPVSRIDVIVGGHSHDRLNTACTVDHMGGASTHIVQAGSRGEWLGRLDLDVVERQGKVGVLELAVSHPQGRGEGRRGCADGTIELVG